MLGAAVALGAAVVLGALRVVVTAGFGVVELAVVACGRDGEDDEHAARPKTAARVTHSFAFATRTPWVTSNDRFTRYGGDGEFGPFRAGWLVEDHEPHGDLVEDRRDHCLMTVVVGSTAVHQLVATSPGHLFIVTCHSRV